MSRRAWMFGAAAGCLLLAACGLSPEAQAAIDVIREMEAQGRCTSEQEAALVRALESTGAAPWVEMGWAVLTGVGAYFGVMLRRGPAERPERLAAKRAAQES